MIVRGPRPTTNFTVLDNATVVRNQRLSWKARGLLAYLLSLPDGWQTSSANLARVAPDGRDSVLTGLSELEAAGFLRRHRVRDSKGRIRTVTVVYDSPQPVDTPGLPQSGIPDPVNPYRYKELTINDVVPGLEHASSSSIHSQTEQADCHACDGTGWTPTPAGDLERCAH